MRDTARAPIDPVEVIADAELVNESPSALDAIAAAGDPQALKALVPQLNALKGEERKTAKAAYDARLAVLVQPIEAAS